jgi:hypothetical protein
MTQIGEVRLGLKAFKAFIRLAQSVFRSLPCSLSMLELLGGDRLTIEKLVISLVVLGSQIKIIFTFGYCSSLLSFLLVKLPYLADGLPKLRLRLFQCYFGIVLIQADQHLPLLDQVCVVDLDR